MVRLDILGLLSASPIIITALTIPPLASEISSADPLHLFQTFTVTESVVTEDNTVTIVKTAVATSIIESAATPVTITDFVTYTSPAASTMTSPVAVTASATPIPSSAARPSTPRAATSQPTSPGADPTNQKAFAGPPHPPPGFGFGGIPNKSFDIPITAAFLVLFLTGGVTNYLIHKSNGKKDHRMHLSALMIDFCTVRVATCSVRIAWATAPENGNLDLATQVFQATGDTVVFVVNLFFAKRILRACHGNFGYRKPVNIFFDILVISAPVMMIYNAVVITLTFFAKKKSVLHILHIFELFGASHEVVLGFLPVIIIALATWIPGSRPVEKFGTGKFRTKVAILLFAAGTLTTEPTLRLVAFLNRDTSPRPQWFDTKPTFYATEFALEIFVIYLFIFTRIDKRFHVPDGCKKAGDYAAGYPQRGWSGSRWKNSFDSETGFARDTSGVSEYDEKIRLRMSEDYGGEENVFRELHEAIQDIQLSHGVTGHPVDVGEDMMLYAFKRRRGPDRPVRPRSPLPSHVGIEPVGLKRPPRAVPLTPKSPRTPPPTRWDGGIAV